MRKVLAFAVIGLAIVVTVVVAQLSPVEHQVVLLAPQLQALAGSPENFNSLANGLQSGSTVTLTTTGADGTREIVAFTPASTLAPQDIAKTLEAARQQLISLGIPSPSASQLGTVLVGGTLSTPSGTAKVAGLVATVDPKHPIAIVVRPFSGSAENYKRMLDGLSKGGAIALDAGAGKPPVAIAPPGGPMSGEEAVQTLRLASQLLSNQGIYDPTPEQIRAALVGGNVKTPSGATVQLRGVLEGRQQPTSASPVAPPSLATPPARTSETPVKEGQPAFTSETKQQGHTSDNPADKGHTSDVPVKKPPAAK